MDEGGLSSSRGRRADDDGFHTVIRAVTDDFYKSSYLKLVSSCILRLQASKQVCLQASECIMHREASSITVHETRMNDM